VRKLFLILLTPIVLACTQDRPTYSIPNYGVEKKYCIEVCVRHTFAMFHNAGQSWGAGSSSMSGLTQTQIFDRVRKECVDFYSNEACCRRPDGDYNNHVIATHIHGYDFGACKK